MGSERPSWESLDVRLMTEPPIWYMPASNDTRVRVLAFSNTIASVRSQRHVGFVALELVLMRRARSSTYAISADEKSLN